MHKRQDSEIWAALFTLAIAAACIVALLRGANPRSYPFIAAEAAFVIGAVWLLLSVSLAWLLDRRRTGIEPNTLTPERRLQQAVDQAACLRKRREVLDARLDVDEPHLCSQYMIGCTCWSFCEQTGDRHAVGASAPPSVQTIEFARKPPLEAQGLPIVRRSAMDNCPFRFAAHAASPMGTAGAKLNSADPGTTAR